MMELEFNSLEEVPEQFRDGFVEHSGKFIPKRTAELLGETKESLSKFHQTNDELANVQSELSTYKKGEAQRIQDAQQKAEEKLRSEGKFDELIKLEKEKLSNAELQFKGEVESWKGKYEELHQSNVMRDNVDLARKIAQGYSPTGMDEGVADMLVSRRIKNVDGTPVFTNIDGEAMSTDDLDLIYQNLEKDPYFKNFAVAANSRGGMGKGSNSSSNRNTITRGAFNDLPPHEQAKAAREKTIIN